ncbi:metal ABC transporter substrate-binding protein [Streptomyces hygroscopicus]|uniref:metal ABC transporter substrate-binding protein n=1 Tax=Streptomyces hygroscopicus TaxID=1912 RepID=UPI0007679EBE|nr:metal ABC transporter substrate-binding protein [Streptomyces hygroscopicus]GLV75171.1 zinc ABC transporter substrate-binding protein [Streptomyces hygroscopicus subsp. hygroscopicus]
MNIRRLIPTTALVGAAALGLTTLTACSSDAGDGRKDGKLDVVASFYPMQFLAERIGGDAVHVSTLTKPGVEPHDLEISPRQTADLSKAGLVVYLKGLQPSVDRAIAQADPEHVADATSYTTLEDHGTEVEGDHGGEEGHDGHAHSGDTAADPHIWLDPVRYAQVAKGVGKALEKADPDHAETFKKNTTALVKQLNTLDQDFRSGLKDRSSDTFITTHAAFGYLSERYGLRQEAISGLDPEAEPSPARVKALHTIAKKDKVNTVFFETLVSDRTAKTLAGDLHLRTDVLDPIEGIGSKSKGDDYLQVMRSNLEALRKALGAK